MHYQIEFLDRWNTGIIHGETSTGMLQSPTEDRYPAYFSQYLRKRKFTKIRQVTSRGSSPLETQWVPRENEHLTSPHMKYIHWSGIGVISRIVLSRHKTTYDITYHCWNYIYSLSYSHWPFRFDMGTFQYKYHIRKEEQYQRERKKSTIINPGTRSYIIHSFFLRYATVELRPWFLFFYLNQSLQNRYEDHQWWWEID